MKKIPILELPQTPGRWESRQAAGALTEEEWTTLRMMVESGEVESVDEAARLRDFWAREIDRESTLEGAPTSLR